MKREFKIFQVNKNRHKKLFDYLCTKMSSESEEYFWMDFPENERFCFHSVGGSVVIDNDEIKCRKMSNEVHSIMTDCETMKKIKISIYQCKILVRALKSKEVTKYKDFYKRVLRINVYRLFQPKKGNIVKFFLDDCEKKFMKN